MEAANAAGMIYLQVKELASSVEVFAEAGLHGEARAQAALAYEIVRGTCFEYWEAEIRVIEAYIERREGNRDRCRTLLKEGLSQAARLHPKTAAVPPAASSRRVRHTVGSPSVEPAPANPAPAARTTQGTYRSRAGAAIPRRATTGSLASITAPPTAIRLKSSSWV